METPATYGGPDQPPVVKTKAPSSVLYIRLKPELKSDFSRACDLAGMTETEAARQLLRQWTELKLGKVLPL